MAARTDAHICFFFFFVSVRVCLDFCCFCLMLSFVFVCCRWGLLFPTYLFFFFFYMLNFVFLFSLFFSCDDTADARDEAPHGACVHRTCGRAVGRARPRGAAAGRRRGSRVERGQNLPRIASCMVALFLLRKYPPPPNHQPPNLSTNHPYHHQARPPWQILVYLILCEVSGVDYYGILAPAVLFFVSVGLLVRQRLVEQICRRSSSVMFVGGGVVAPVK